MLRTRILTVSIFAVMLSASLLADRVRLRSGQSVTGQFVSADVRVVKILLENGTIAEYAIADVAALEFTPRAVPPSPQPQPITLPAGTVLHVVLTQPIDVDVTKAGTTFRAIVADAVMYAGKVAVPRNTAVVVQAAKVEPAKGADKISLKANTLSFGGRKYDIVTAYAERKGEGEGKKTAVAASGTERLKLPTETRLQFTLSAALTVQP